MDPVSMGLALGGVALSAFGAYDKYKGAQAQTDIQKQMIGTEEQQNAIRRTAMETQARRMSLQNARQSQQANAQALNATTQSGAQFSSALGGAYGGIAGASGTNQLGISQGLQAGEQMFNLEDTLNQQKIKYADAGGLINTGTALSGLGGAITQNLKPLNDLSRQFGGNLFNNA